MLLSLRYRYVSALALGHLQVTRHMIEDGPVQGPKQVASLNKDNNIRLLCFDSKESLFSCK